MKKEIVIVLAEDDEGHAKLIIHNLKKAGIANEVLHFTDGEETLNFLFRKGNGPHRDSETSYILLLDIRMPMVDGIEVLKQVKQDDKLQNTPVIMVTTTDEPNEIRHCYSLGCSNYIVKPVNYEKFNETFTNLGHHLLEEVIPEINSLI